MLLLGAGPRALLLQLAHPLVAAGVDEHSDFPDRPVGPPPDDAAELSDDRLRTSTAARAEIRRLNELHRTIRGSGYAARDPDLSLWVHATLVDTTIVAYDAWIEPLPRDDRERYYAETLPIGRAFGVPADRLPADLAAFEAYVAAMLAPADRCTRRRLPATSRGTSCIRRSVPCCRPSRTCPRPRTRGRCGRSIGLLPASVRAGYGFHWGPLERAASTWLVAAWRFWRPLLPSAFRQMPHALAADRRVAAIDVRRD
jgi:uncharacterized protein (DUF2236 family)